LIAHSSGTIPVLNLRPVFLISTVRPPDEPNRPPFTEDAEVIAVVAVVVGLSKRGGAAATIILLLLLMLLSSSTDEGDIVKKYLKRYFRGEAHNS
jgi:hypothetical protein